MGIFTLTGILTSKSVLKRLEKEKMEILQFTSGHIW